MKLRPPEVLDCKEFSPGQIASVEVKYLTPPPKKKLTLAYRFHEKFSKPLILKF